MINSEFYSMIVFLRVGKETEGVKHPYLGHPSISKKKYTIKSMLFSISMRKTESPCGKKFFVTFGTSEKIEVKRGHFVKK